MFAILFALLSVSFCYQNYARTIIFAKEKKSVALTNALSYNDPYNSKMPSIGYSSQEIQDLKSTSVDIIQQYYGFNVTNGTYIPLYDGYSLPYGQYIPFDIGRDDYADRNIYDSKKPSSGNTMNKFRSYSGWLLNIVTNGVFPGGINGGRLYYAGDIITVGYLNILEENSDWTKQQNNERFFCFSHIPAHTYKNMYNLASGDSIFTWTCRDSEQRLGYGEVTTRFYANNFGTYDDIKRTILTFS